jgi:hypothetical protein
LVKPVLKTNFKEIAQQASDANTCLNKSSAKWTVRVRATMVDVYGDDWAFIALCETRWNSMQGCFASLLRVRFSLQIITLKYRSHPDFPAALVVFGRDELWAGLEAAILVIRPLFNACFKMKRDQTTLGDVVVIYRDLYEAFHRCEEVRNANLTLVPLIEDLWAECEQPVFMLAYFLHPHTVELDRKLPPTRITSMDKICDIAVYYYRRFLPDFPVGNLRGDSLK